MRPPSWMDPTATKTFWQSHMPTLIRTGMSTYHPCRQQQPIGRAGRWLRIYIELANPSVPGGGGSNPSDPTPTKMSRLRPPHEETRRPPPSTNSIVKAAAASLHIDKEALSSCQKGRVHREEPPTVTGPKPRHVHRSSPHATFRDGGCRHHDDASGNSGEVGFVRGVLVAAARVFSLSPQKGTRRG